MPLRPSLPWLLLTLAAALLAMYLACRSMQISESAIAAAVFAVVLCVTAVRTNAPHWRRAMPATGSAVTPRTAMMTNAFLIMLAFLWCGLAFYAVYLGTHVRWQHGWEYGTACMLFAGAYGYYLTRLSNPADNLAQTSAIDRMAKIAAYQAILIGIGLVWLIGAGKLAITHKGDWAANQLFLGGGFAILCISVILIKTNAALCDRSAATAG
ncbi:hypothetical protein [Hyphomicrobium sp.]|uniref:hypothetical protein n=1 Tax=Hyphomicrobium sp. TaxID=82 RepID=UPI00356756B8